MAALKICKEVSKIYESNGITLWVHDYIKLVLFQLKEIYNCCLRGLKTITIKCPSSAKIIAKLYHIEKTIWDWGGE
ncbi:hypothetical protein CDQ84_16825 [Clostridium thermosuccinogenes]|uniref:Uncharacterized protein n=1 Tax=Clostridium thermosuccinogenes TaxID=84032 RepID=A0A2K2F848_9CLOT|nr:hypothetical protein [Pseudoclostridium thermosuccinogenes]AUS96600.1 hypothetical protein CDO33_09210 [Pseudoclostridium thermosuccinogenes]PNT92739.1 hypothetical protein CDQ83_04035 [Pseudoclostridium thermosuccinogenes]PNT94945.1 hypothetical protein CDQ85_16590 [Pseudoclostridium thermosuccinogenes]PNT95591.1 hypothetical protein CDQ84_16825 [Pseudoclostridium thermosuccinogenes]